MVVNYGSTEVCYRDPVENNDEEVVVPDTGQRIREARERKGISTAELAAAVGVGEAAIKKVEAGGSKAPSLATALLIAQALVVDPWWIAFGEETKLKQSLRAQRLWRAGLLQLDAADGGVEPPWATKAEVQKVAEDVLAIRASLKELTRSRRAAVLENRAKPATPPSDAKRPPRQRRRKKAG